MKEIIQLTGVRSLNDDLETFSGKLFKVSDDMSYFGDFPVRTSFVVSRKKDKRLFEFLMDKGIRENMKISYDFIKKELKNTKKSSKEGK
jgi:hypothetical protein